MAEQVNYDRLADGPVITVPTITLEGDANSRANIRIGRSQAGSGTICLRKRRRPLRKLSSISTTIDRR